LGSGFEPSKEIDKEYALKKEEDTTAVKPHKPTVDMGFETYDDEVVLGKAEFKKNRKFLGFLFIVIGICFIVGSVYAYLVALPILSQLPLLLIPAVAFIVIGLLLFFFFEEIWTLFVTNYRIAEEYLGTRKREVRVEDHHYRFFESTEVYHKTKEKQTALRIQKSSGSMVVLVLPNELVGHIIDQSRQHLSSAK